MRVDHADESCPTSTQGISILFMLWAQVFFRVQQVFPLLFHRMTQFSRYADLLRKVVFPMIRARRIDNRNRAGVITLFYFLPLQSRVDAGAPDSPVNIE